MDKFREIVSQNYEINNVHFVHIFILTHTYSKDIRFFETIDFWVTINESISIVSF